MKEFEKKNPNREPASEGMKGLSKFLPMTDSNYRRRLTEYEVQVQDLQAYVRSLEAETGRLRKKMEEGPREFMVLENKLREANRQLVQAFNQNEKLVNAPLGPMKVSVLMPVFNKALYVKEAIDSVLRGTFQERHRVAAGHRAGEGDHAARPCRHPHQRSWRGLGFRSRVSRYRADSLWSYSH